MKLKDSDRFTINPEVSFREMEGQIVVINPTDGEMMTFNEIGNDVWEGIKSEKIFLQIIKDIANKYSVNVDLIQNDILIFVEQLISAKIISKLM